MKEIGTYHNLEQVIKIADGSQEFVDTLVSTFVVEMRKMMTHLSVAVESDSQIELSRIAHSIKPSLLLFGITFIVDDMLWLEMNGRNQSAPLQEVRHRTAHCLEILEVVLSEISE